MPYRSVFDVVWSGRRHIMMMASQIDRTGNQNISAIGDRTPSPRCSSSACAAPRATRSTTRRATGCPTTACARFVEQVDVVVRRRLRPGRGRRARRHPLPRHPPRRLQPRRLRLRDARAHHAAALVPPRRDASTRSSAATGFELAVPDDVAETRLPDARGARPHPRRARPRLAARPRGADAERRRDARRARTRRCAPALCERVGVRYPLVQTGMGWVAGPRLVAATCEAGRPRHPGLGHHDARRAGRRHRRGAQPRRRRPSASTCAPTWPTSASASSCMIETGARVASFAQAPNPALVTRCKEAGLVRHAHGRRPAPRREGGRVGRRRRHRPGRRGRRAHRHRPDDPAAAPGRRRRRRPRPGPRGRRLLRAAAASSPPSPTGPPAWPWAPGSCSRPRAGCPTPSRSSTSARP